MPREFRQALLKKATVHLSKSRREDLAELLYKLRVEYKVRALACERGSDTFPPASQTAPGSKRPDASPV